MTAVPAETTRRIEDAAAALIAAGNPNPTNDQVRQHLGGGSLSHISPVMRAFRARQRELAGEKTPPLPAELAQLLTGQLGMLWQAASRQAEEATLAAREQADADIAQADAERDAALSRVAQLESDLAVLREVEAERDRLLNEQQRLQESTIALREDVARLAATAGHQADQLAELRGELKETRKNEALLQKELLAMARTEQAARGRKA